MRSTAGKRELAARADRERRAAQQEMQAAADRIGASANIELELLLDRIARLEKVLLSDAVVERLAQYRRFLVPVEDWHQWQDYPKVSQWVPLHQVATVLARARKERARLMTEKEKRA